MPHSPSSCQRPQPGAFVLGIDGGGTKTLAMLAAVSDQGQPRVLGRAAAGTSNPVAAGWDTALANLSTAIEQAFVDADLDRSLVTRAIVALSGSGRPEAQQRVCDYLLQNCQIDSVDVVHDGLAVLAAGMPDCCGVALIVGTGTVAYSVGPSGDTRVTGGWGYWFGDEGSAFWLGQSALRAVSQAADGRGPQTMLTQSVLDRLQLTEPRSILSALIASGDTRQAIAGLADLVVNCAERDDIIANNILTAAAEHWVIHIKCLGDQLFPGSRFPLAVAGGVLTGSPLSCELLQRQLRQAQLAVDTCEVVEEPVLGCLQLACR